MATPKTTATTAPDVTSWQAVGRNIRFTTLDGLLFIAVPISDAAIASAPDSASGKSKSLASTEGNVTVPGTAIKMGVNVYTPVKAAVPA